jgi:hypothetical protein
MNAADRLHVMAASAAKVTIPSFISSHSRKEVEIGMSARRHCRHLAPTSAKPKRGQLRPATVDPVGCKMGKNTGLGGMSLRVSTRRTRKFVQRSTNRHIWAAFAF